MKIHNAQLIIGVLIGLMFLLGGCSSKTDEVYQESIQNGLDAIAEEKFSKAEGLFETALNLKEDDVKAKSYLNQVQLIVKADELVKQNKIDDAVKLLVAATKVKEGSKVIAAKSQEKKETLLKFQENQKSYNTLLSDAKKLSQSGDYNKSNEKLDSLLKENLTEFVAIKDEAIKLKDSNDKAIKNAEIVQATRETQENDPLAWAPGIKEAFEKEMVQNGYVEAGGPFFYRDGYIGGDNQGYYSLYTIDAEYGERYVVTVNVKTGWYHG